MYILTFGWICEHQPHRQAYTHSDMSLRAHKQPLPPPLFFFTGRHTHAYMPVTVIHMIILLSEKETGSCQGRQERRPHISPAVRGGEQTMTLT